VEKDSNQKGEVRGRKHGRAVALLEFVLTAVLSGSIFYEYMHNSLLQNYLRNAISSNAPVLQFALPVSVAAIAGTLFFQRRRDARETRLALLREQILSNMKFGEAVLPHAETIPHHQIVFERPARDNSFPIGVTNKKGKLSKIREAERLPPDDSS